MKKKLVVLTGAGISAESGIKTFRDADGLWEGHNVMDVATPEGWQPGDKVIAEGTQKVRPGMTVNPKPFVPDAPAAATPAKPGDRPASPAPASKG